MNNIEDFFKKLNAIEKLSNGYEASFTDLMTKAMSNFIDMVYSWDLETVEKFLNKEWGWNEDRS